MIVKIVACLALLSKCCAIAATSGFLLGVDYSEWFDPNATQIATDSSGALYILSTVQAPAGAISHVTKLSADGKTILWQNELGFAATTMAVDPNGGVYVIPAAQPGDTSLFVEKLTAGATGVVWKTAVGFSVWPQVPVPPVLAADSQGRAYVTGGSTDTEGTVVRLNAAGSAIDYTAHVAGIPSSIAVDGSGTAFVAGYVPSNAFTSTSFLARLAPDGSVGYYSSGLANSSAFPTSTVAVDASGDAALRWASSGDILQRFDSVGNVVFSKSIPAEQPALYRPELAMDAYGNAYVLGSPSVLYSVRDSLATCGTTLLSVIAPDGSLLQGTYVPHAANVFLAFLAPLIVTGPGSTLFLVVPADGSFAPTRTGPFPAGSFGTNFLQHLSPNTNAQTYPLACLGNAASYDSTSPLAPGEIVALFGNGLGPQEGIQTSATLQSPFPTKEGDVQVTFDGTPAPLMWVQDAQINAVVPWSLTPGQTTQVCVSNNTVKTNCLTWPVAQTAPGVFTVDGVYAAALNQDGTINSAENPAPQGSVVTVFATGLGPIAPPQADGSLVGLPLPTNTLSAALCGLDSTLQGPVTLPWDGTTVGPAPNVQGDVPQMFAAAPAAGSAACVWTGSQLFSVYYVYVPE